MLQGFDGSEFTFHGRPGQWSVLLSSELQGFKLSALVGGPWEGGASGSQAGTAKGTAPCTRPPQTRVSFALPPAARLQMSTSGRGTVMRSMLVEAGGNTVQANITGTLVGGARVWKLEPTYNGQNAPVGLARLRAGLKVTFTQPSVTRITPGLVVVDAGGWAAGGPALHLGAESCCAAPARDPAEQGQTARTHASQPAAPSPPLPLCRGFP